MEFRSIIASRRDGEGNTEPELRFLANGAANAAIPDYQLAAWLMAAYLRPLDERETAWLTLAMADSGERIDLTGLPKPWVDKHSTGGVGDKTSIVLLPILAACGLTVVKMSGRGLGITGGTVDKLDSVPGFRVDLSPSEMKAQALNIGLALTGQSPDLAPADKALYALRDVTETVGSIPLIVSSILSKKLASGADTIVLDVKCGSGAFMKTREAASDLATALHKTAKLCGLTTRIAITDMMQPLGAAIGNALEVREALEVLGSSPAAANDWGNTHETTPKARFRRLCVELASLTLEAAGIANSPEDAHRRVSEALHSGAARAKAKDWFVAQGADDPFCTRFVLPEAPVQTSVAARSSGWISQIDAETVGVALISLGGGRTKKEDAIEPSVGIVLDACVGTRVDLGAPLFTIHAADAAHARDAEEQILSAIKFSPTPVTAQDPLIETR